MVDSEGLLLIPKRILGPFMVDGQVKGRIWSTHISAGQWVTNFLKRATGHLSGFSGVAHIFGLNARASALVLFVVSPVRVFVPLSADNSTYSSRWTSH